MKSKQEAMKQLTLPVQKLPKSKQTPPYSKRRKHNRRKIGVFKKSSSKSNVLGLYCNNPLAGTDDGLPVDQSISLAGSEPPFLLAKY